MFVNVCILDLAICSILIYMYRVGRLFVIIGEIRKNIYAANISALKVLLLPNQGF